MRDTYDRIRELIRYTERERDKWEARRDHRRDVAEIMARLHRARRREEELARAGGMGSEMPTQAGSGARAETELICKSLYSGGLGPRRIVKRLTRAGVHPELARRLAEEYRPALNREMESFKRGVRIIGVFFITGALASFLAAGSVYISGGAAVVAISLIFGIVFIVFSEHI